MMRLNEETPATDFGDDRGSPCGSGSKGANQKSRNPAPFICASILIGDQIGHAWSAARIRKIAATQSASSTLKSLQRAICFSSICVALQD